MRTILITSLAAVLMAATAGATQLTVERGSDLQSVINYAANGDTIILGEKVFAARPIKFVDSLCGNCLDPRTPIEATHGFVIRGKSLVLIGQSRTRSRLETNAGYGLFIVDCPGVEISNLTITGGKRDPDGNATDAGIVVRNSRARISDVDVRDNTHRLDSVVVGIGGIFGREGAELEIRNCNILNNGWDGVALYRGAAVTVTDCVIKDGRGAGIGVTWDASCTAYRNEISGFWKGIGAFGTSWVVARNNLVHENLGWGIIATGQAYMDVTNNVVYHNGNCGVAPWSSDCRGRIANNIIANNGWREQWVCPCVGVWNNGDWAKWDFRFNIVNGNVAGNYEGIWSQTDIHGNLDTLPGFVEDGDFHLAPESAGMHGGDTLIYNVDGTRSHIGLYGGPQAKRSRR